MYALAAAATIARAKKVPVAADELKLDHEQCSGMGGVNPK